MNRCRVSCIALTAALTLLALAGRPADLHAQQGVTTGSITGRIVDNTGAPLAGATVTVRNVDTGVTREVQTNEDGRYTAGFLQTGSYTVSAEFPPLPAEERGPIRVNLGDQKVIDVALRPVEVEAIAVLVSPENQVDVKQGGVVELVDSEEIENLPTLGRDFTDFINLSGLVSPTPEVTTGGQFSLGGGRTSATNVQIDGVDANNAFFGENRGSSRIPFTFSLESIKEFQIITNGFDVEFGNYSGGVVNAVTKGGTNEFHGSGFGYFRDKSLTADDFSGLTPNDFSVQQFGLRLGGPIVRDKAHFFFTLDGQQKDQPVFALVPDRWGGSPDSLARFEDILERVYGVSAGEIRDNIGQFKETEDEIALFGRVDWQLNDRNLLTLRHNFTDLDEDNDRIGNEEARTHGAKFADTSNSFVSELTSVLGDRGAGYNTARFQWSYEDRPRPGNDVLPEADVTIDDNATDVEYFGDGIVFRNRLEEGKVQVVDNLTWELAGGRHTLKAGTNDIFTNIKNLFWLLGNGIYEFDSLEDFENQNARSYFRLERADGEAPFAEFNISEYSFYAQDEWQLSDRFLVALGLRYDSDVFEDPATSAPEVAAAFGTTTLVSGDQRQMFTGVATPNVPEDRNNVSPRIAFTYDVSGDQRAVVRGGVGLLYGRMPFVLHGNVMQASPPLLSIFCSGEDVPPPDYDFFRQAPNGENNPDRCTGGGAPGGRPEFSVWDEDFENPETWKLNLGYEQVVGDGWRTSVDFLYGRTTENFNVVNLNQREEQFRTAVDNRPVFVTPDRFGGFSVSSSARIQNLDFQNVYLNVSDAEAEAYSLTFKLGRTFAERGIRFDASYTYNNIHDNSSFFCCTSNEGFRTKQTAGDPNFIGDFGDEDTGTWGHADFERRHVLILSGTWNAPFGIDISGIWRSQSGTPYTLIVEGDINGDGQTFNDRAPVFDDLQFENAEEAAQWQALLQGGGGDAGECLREERGRIARRNTCNNPWFHSVDLHISKEIGWADGQAVELIADLFNVLNGLNEDWGRFVFVQQNDVLNKRGFDPETNKVIYRVNDGFGQEAATGFQPLQFQAQLGVRYRF